tara:strand:+ start:35132 stop:35485 length:354 start_codon:yes stop_codon:yes gene_type:complete
MHTQFAHDLCAARRKAGLSTKDIGTLLELGQPEIAMFESGKRPPSLLEICKISLIYNRSFDSLYKAIRTLAKKELFQQMPSLDSDSKEKASRFNRENTLKRLHGQLIGDLRSDDGGS